jgi:hypothetical protein
MIPVRAINTLISTMDLYGTPVLKHVGVWYLSWIVFYDLYCILLSASVGWYTECPVYCMITGKVRVALYLRTKRNLYPTSHICPIWLKFSSSDLDIMPWSNYECQRIQRRKGHTFLISVNEITFTCTTSSGSPPHPLCSTYISHLDKTWWHFLITVTAIKILTV